MFTSEQRQYFADRATEKAEAQAAAEYPPGPKRDDRIAELSAFYYGQYVTPPQSRCPHCGK